jgi:hypothetical protein
MRYAALIILSLFCAAAMPAASRPGAHPAGQPKYFSCRVLDINAWKIYTTNYGPFVCPQSGSGGYWNGPYNYIYGAGLWVGALDLFDSMRVSVGYNSLNGTSEFGPINPFTGLIPPWEDPLARTYLSTDINDLRDWPVRDHQGILIIKSQQDGYSAYNDLNPQFTFEGERPVGGRWASGWTSPALPGTTPTTGT